MIYASEQTSEGNKIAGPPVWALNTWLLHKARKILRFEYKHRNDVERLNARLRRDAGIDEIELERERLRQAPLIRSRI